MNILKFDTGPSLRITVPLYLVRCTMGFTVGLYLFNYAAVIFNPLSAKYEDGHAEWIFGSNTALMWTAWVFVFGIILEALLEMPTGVLADALGRKFATFSSLLFRGLYFLALFKVGLASDSDANISAASDVLNWAFGALFLFSIHYTLYSGSFAAWLRDALEEEGKAPQFTSVWAAANRLYWFCFVVGTALGTLLYIYDFVRFAYLLGAGLCFLCAGVCVVYMRENQGYSFAEPIDLVRNFPNILRAGSAIWRSGFFIFRTDPCLWITFLANATLLSLIYLVDYIWPVFAEQGLQYISRADPAKENLPWGLIALILVFALASLVGTVIITALLRRLESKNYTTNPRILAGLVASSNILFSLPIFFAAHYVGEGAASRKAPFDEFLLFFILMAIHKILHGVCEPLAHGLQNVLIKARTQERSTVLSIGALFQNIPIVGLVLIGVGQRAGGLGSWRSPAWCSIIAAVCLVAVIWSYRRGDAIESQPPSASE